MMLLTIASSARRLAAVLAAIGSLCCGAPSLAGVAPDCFAVANAMLVAGAQPAGRQTHVALATGAPEGIAAVLRPDAMYLRDAPGGEWRVAPLPTSARQTMAQKALETKPPRDCRRMGNEPINGVMTQVFSFSQPNAETPDETSDLRIWIDFSGLIRRLQVSESTAVDYEYGDFPAP